MMKISTGGKEDMYMSLEYNTLVKHLQSKDTRTTKEYKTQCCCLWEHRCKILKLCVHFQSKQMNTYTDALTVGEKNIQIWIKERQGKIL